MATETAQNLNETTATPAGSEAVLLILVTASFSHLLNDTIQSLIPAIYPVATPARPNATIARSRLSIAARIGLTKTPVHADWYANGEKNPVLFDTSHFRP
jgi:hypothetical protein